MMRYLVGVIVGAIIGYFTNWLAIKMLFRPYKEKRILGMKVPFTPGLIPKEKDRMAKNISESVGEHLLNEESIAKSLKEPAVKVKIKEAIELKVDEFLLTKGTVGERAVDLFGVKSDELVKAGEIKVKGKIVSIIKEKNEEGIISDFLYKEINKKLNDEPMLVKNFLNSIDTEKISLEILKLIPKEKIYDSIENNIKNKIAELEEEDKLIGDIIPESVFEAIDNYIVNHKEEISLEICKTLRKDSVSSSIKEKIEETLFSGLKGLVTMFLSVDMVYEKLVSAVEVYLADEDNQRIVCSYISNYVNSISEVKIESFVNNMPADLNRNMAKIIADKGLDYILSIDSLNNYKELLINYVASFESYDSLIKSIDSDYKEKLKLFLSTVINKIVNGEELTKSVDLVVSYGKEQLLNYDFSNDIEKSKAAKRLINELIEKNYDNIVDKEIAQILDIVDIPKIVEDQINSFEVDYAEKLILDIANKELRAITWLGALLGGILGILSPIIGSIKF